MHRNTLRGHSRLAFALNEPPHPGPPPGEDPVLDRLERTGARVSAARIIALGTADILLLVAGLPALCIYVWNHPEAQTPQALGGVGLIVTVVLGIRGAIDKLEKSGA